MDKEMKEMKDMKNMKELNLEEVEQVSGGWSPPLLGVIWKIVNRIRGK